MKHYETPEMENIILELVDVLTVSDGTESDFNPVEEVPGGGNDPWP